MPRTDRTRAAVLLWGGWLLVTGAVLSFAGGIIHTYYTVELAPAIAALVAIGAVVLWRARAATAARVALAAGVLVTGLYAYSLLHKTPSFYPWLAWLVVLAAAVSAALFLTPPGKLTRGLAVLAIGAGVVAATSGPAAYALNTAATPHTGSTPSAGPAITSGFGGGGTGRPGGFGNRNGAGDGGNGAGPGGLPGGTGGFPGGTGNTANGSTGNGSTGSGNSGTTPGAPSGSSGSAGGAPGGGGMGGGAASVSADLTKLIENTDTKWAAATIGSQTAGPLELATGKAVMAIGGFTGSDDSTTLAQFQQWVTQGKIRYFIGGGGMGGGRGGGGSSSAISEWVSANFTATTVGNTTVYDLTKKASS